MQFTETSSIPEQGQIVAVRQRRYVVSDVERSTLPPLVLQSRQIAPQHLVTLTSIEDDALGEGLQVVWEVEPGAHIIEQEALPDPTGFDSPHRLDAFLDAVRWGAISSADARALQAPFRSGIEIEDYQLDPLVRAVQMPRVNLLVADDVGLGKTVESGLVTQELIVRNRARTVLIVCPAGLQIHWRDQMRDKFGLEFRIVDSQLMKQLRRNRGIHVNPWSHFPRLITSIDFVKRERPMRLFREALPAEVTYPRRFDILVVDEAHNVAPSGRGHYAIDSLRTAAIRTIAPHFEHKLFVTATPHNGYQESFSALLELLDNQRFARGVMPNRAQLEAVMVRRLKSELTHWDGSPRFPQRRLDVIEVDYTDEERQVHRWLKEYTRLRLKNADSQEERFAAEFVLKLLKKRLFSSPAAFAATLREHEQTITQSDAASARSSTNGQHRRPSLGILRRQIAQVEEEYADDLEYEEAEVGAMETATRMVQPLTPRERKLLEQMRHWAETAIARRDCKTRAFIDWLRAIVRPDGKWSDQRVIIFTEYRATLNWLNEVLAAEKLAGEERLMTLYGGMDSDQREAIKAAFQASPGQSAVRILLATDAASEGIDLQNYCHRLVHFEVPWNPNRMEQRNGRIDRHGQTRDPLIFHFVGQGYRERILDSHAAPADDLAADLEFLMRAAEKVEQIREDLGKVGPVIAEQVEEAMLGKRRYLDTRHAENEAGAVRRILKFERDLRRQIEKHLSQLWDTQKELRLSRENVQAVVEIALELAGQPGLIPTGVRQTETNGQPPLPQPSFYLPNLSGSWSICTEGLAHPHTGEIRPVVFDHKLAKARDDVVLVHLNHRLVQMALRLLRAEVWSPEGRKGLHRVTARHVPNHAAEMPVVIAHARLVVIGGDSHRLHEEVITVGGIIQPGKKDRPFRRLNVGETQAILDAAIDEPVSAKMQAQLQSQWDRVKPALVQALEARMKDRLAGMQRLLDERRDKEMIDIEMILRELAAAIEQELEKPAYQQLELFSMDERSQLNRNTAALQARLEQIPGEIEAETAAIEARFADPQPRMFPVAVTFLVPERFDH